MENCSYCYSSRLPACNGFIYVVSGILDFENYFWKLTDKFGNIYTGECTPSYTDSGAFIIDPDSDLPDGLLKSFSGGFVLQVVDIYDLPQTMTFGGTEYGCVQIEFYDAQGADLQSQIQ